ncbi:MAG TPA: transcription termination factor NusA [Bryobacteraceae bacterium]|nr:transcription termination factor NusA [Bryobacteraceae bacterium]
MASIFESIEILSKEKGIDPQIVINAVKDAMLVAARKQFRTLEDLVAEVDPKSDKIHIYAVKRVVDDVQDSLNELTLGEAMGLDPGAQVGQEIRIPKGTESLGRISAQTAKQVILQKVREAERETIYTEYADRVGELVNCTVKRIEGQDIVCDLGKTEARLPKKEQSKLEGFTVGERVRCVIKSVDKAGKNAGVIVSRAAPDLVMRLFEQEVPEIYDSTVVIKGCAREAGERTKIAVLSRDRDVDCVGACVGMKGMRVQSIIRELRGEKIDIIEYSEDPVIFATHALSPAKISRVSIVDAMDHHMEVIVDDTQLSLAIGKKGQNVRLAAKLLGWKIDIKSEEEKRQEVESQMAALVAPGAPISVLLDYGLQENIVEKLFAGGVPTVERLGGMTPEELEAIPGIGPDLVEHIRDVVVGYYGQYDDAAEVPQDDESQEQQPTLEIGEEGYNYSESAETAESSPNPADDEPALAAESEPLQSDELDAGAEEQSLEVDEDESAKLRNAE